MIILGIETSCDETAVCLIQTEGQKIKILGNQLYSQASKHADFGGVFPTLAKREHAKNLVPLLEKCLDQAKTAPSFQTSDRKNNPLKNWLIKRKLKKILAREPDLYEALSQSNLIKKIPAIDLIAVTTGPGLEPALWVGINFARGLNIVWNRPVASINHMEGHIVAALLQNSNLKNPAEKFEYTMQEIKYPAIALLISGGHTQLVLITDYKQYEIIGNTRDDAVGEAYDKVARLLGLPYPGGRAISQLAQKERTEFPNKKNRFSLPRPMIHSHNLDFSFSGLKTAVLYLIKKMPALTETDKQEIALEFERAVIEVLVEKTRQAIKTFSPATFIVGGGVSADEQIRLGLERLCLSEKVNFFVPERNASTDNALMIAVAGFMRQSGTIETPETELRAEGNLTLS